MIQSYLIYFLLIISINYLNCFKINQLNSSKNDKQNKVIVILADGIRYDYLNNLSDLKGFQYLTNNGVKSPVYPIFPANSYPNWYTILTGKYAENHGFVNNFMYDSKYNSTFLMSPETGSHHEYWWNESIPVWITAEKNGIKTANYWWDGCSVKIDGLVPTKCEPYQSYWTWHNLKNDFKAAFDTILNNFKRDDWQFALLYYEPIDSNGHVFGPNSVSRRDALKDLDDLLIYLIEGIQSNNLENNVNLLLVSDHGMLDVQSKKEKTTLIDIENYLNENDVELMLDRGPVCFIVPKANKEEKILEDLKKANIKGLNYYRREDVPKEYHFNNHRRIGPIVLIADRGFFIRGFSEGEKTKPHWDVVYKGHHGYAPNLNEMKTIMYGLGPKFKKNYLNEPLIMTDHYNLICNLLEISPLPNDGNWTRVRNMMDNESNRKNKFEKINKIIKSSKSFKRESAYKIKNSSTILASINFINLFISLSLFSLFQFKKNI